MEAEVVDIVEAAATGITVTVAAMRIVGWTFLLIAPAPAYSRKPFEKDSYSGDHPGPVMRTLHGDWIVAVVVRIWRRSSLV
jgi:hypothetical protein